jgi:ABC-type dipeptide/oligopeptide/nickel transport system ATPase component
LTTQAAPGSIKPRSSGVVLRSSDLYKRYGTRPAVKALNLEVRQGEIFGFLGPNGAGKTTTIRMMLGLITPTAGRIEVLGRDVATHKAHVLPRVGVLIETQRCITICRGAITYAPSGLCSAGCLKRASMRYWRWLGYAVGSMTGSKRIHWA